MNYLPFFLTGISLLIAGTATAKEQVLLSQSVVSAQQGYAYHVKPPTQTFPYHDHHRANGQPFALNLHPKQAAIPYPAKRGPFPFQPKNVHPKARQAIVAKPSNR